MSPLVPLTEFSTRLAAGAAGVIALLAAVRAVSEARLHMLLSGELCGLSAAAPHCVWCPVALIAGVGGLGALAYALRPRRGGDAMTAD